MSTNGYSNGHVNGHSAIAPPRHADFADPTRLPPQSLECEAGVLGAMLIDNRVIPAVLDILGADDFYRDSHRAIFRAIRDLHESGRPADAILVMEHMTTRGDYDRIGGDEALAAVLGQAPSAANATYYAAIVREKAVKRRTVEAGHEILRAGYADEHTADELLDLARGLMPEGSTGPADPMTCLADVEAEHVSWLWPRRFPAGMLSLLVGDPSVGKSFITLGMAATISRGYPWPDSQGECAPEGSTVLLSAEDSLAVTIRPRLDAAGADCRKVHALTTVRGPAGRLRGFSLAADLPRLEAVLKRLGDCRLVVIDPVSAYLGGVDEHKNADVRGLIAPLSKLAERYGVAVVLVTHLNKGAGSKALYRATGSLAFVAAARMAWLVVKDKDERGRQMMLPVKHNIVERPGGLAYRIQDGVIHWDPTPLDHDADEALAGGPGGEGRATKPMQAEGWLRELFEVPGTRIPSNVVLKLGEAAGLLRRPLFDAKKKLGIRADKDRTRRNGEWVWFRPESHTSHSSHANQDEPPIVPFRSPQDTDPEEDAELFEDMTPAAGD